MDDGAVGSLSLEAASVDEAQAIGTAVFHPHAVRPLDRGGTFRLGIDAFHAGPLTVGTLEYNRAAHIETGPYDVAYQVNVPLEGQLRTAAGRDRLVATARRAAVYRRDVPTVLEGWGAGSRILAVRIERRALEARLAAMIGTPVDCGIPFAIGLDLDTGWGREWFSYVTLFARQLDAPNSLLRHPLLATTITEAMLSGLLRAASYPQRELLSAESAPAGPSSVRHATEAIDAAPELPITVDDLATVSGTTVRALQLGFRYHLRTTPLGYLRQVRLERARLEIESTDLPISEIAARWGFAHLGRFAADYADRFGELPSDARRTIRKTKSD